MQTLKRACVSYLIHQTAELGILTHDGSYSQVDPDSLRKRHSYLGRLWHQLQPFCQLPANPHLWHHGKLRRTQKQSRESPILVPVGSACCPRPTQRTVVKAALPEGTAGGWEASCIRDGCLGVVPSPLHHPLPAMPPTVFTITWSQLPTDRYTFLPPSNTFQNEQVNIQLFIFNSEREREENKKHLLK